MNRLESFLKSLFFKNTIPKLICLILAFLSWIFVMENQNIRKNRTFENLPVEVFGLEVLENKGLIVESISGEFVDVTIDGNWTSVMSFTQKDIFLSATVDATGKGQVTVPINVRLANATVTVKELSQNHLKVQFDAVETQMKEVEVTTVGELPEGYELGSVTPRHASIAVQGPSNVLKTIAVLSGKIDISSRTMSDVEFVDIQALDSQGNPVDASKIELAAPFVEVDLSIMGTKEVPVHVISTGHVAENHRLGTISSVPEKVVLYGDTKKLSTIRELNCTVQVEEKSAPFSTNATFDLPEGIRRVDQDPVTIQVDVLQLITKQFYFLNSEIEVRGIDASLKYELGTTDLGNQIMVTDTRSVINTIKAENLVFYIDVERVTGNYLADIKVEGLPETSSVSFRIPQIDVIITEGTTP
jgi:YbbR domain-containing protein